MGLFVLFMGVGTFFEAAYYPERMRIAVLLYAFEVGIAVIGVALCQPARFHHWSESIAVAVGACVSAYYGMVGRRPSG